MSRRAAACCCKINNQSGSCCLPDGTCVNVPNALDCSSRGGVFRKGVSCNGGGPCPPPGTTCQCDDANWRRLFLTVQVERIYARNLSESTNGQAPTGLNYTFTEATFIGLGYATTQAQIDAGQLPSQAQDNPFGPALPLGITTVTNGYVTSIYDVRCYESAYPQQCCTPVNAILTARGLDYFYQDEQGVTVGPFPSELSRAISLPAHYSPTGQTVDCYECCCNRDQGRCPSGHSIC